MMNTETLQPPPALEVDGLYCTEPGKTALCGLTLTVSAGQLHAIAGPNGSGKGTLCRCLARIYKWSKGSIRFNGKPTPNSTEELAAVGIMVVLQGTRVFNEMTVRDNLFSSPTFWRLERRADRMDEVLQLFPRLKDRLGQVAGSLSGGEQQMTALARALMTNPRLLIAEEPSMGLAPSLVEDVYAALANIARVERTVIVTEETLVAASRVATSASLMVHGKVVASGDPKRMMETSIMSELKAFA